METNNQHSFSDISSKLPVSLFARLAHTIHNVFSADRSAKPEINTGVKVASTSTFPNKHETIISLLNQGKHYDDAAHIAQVAEEWGIDLSALDSKHVNVKGQSVWIDLEG